MRDSRLRLGLALVFLVACSPSSDSEQSVTESREELVACTAHALKVVDLHADVRDIWAGRETTQTGKQADPLATVVVDFTNTVVPAQVTAQFVPAVTNGSCGATVAATTTGSILPNVVWGSSTSTTGRPVMARPYNVLVRESIAGIVSSAGAIAAGGDITLTSFSVNGTVKQPVGLIAGGKVVLSNGSVQGNLTYGVASTIPGTVTVSGTKTLQPFDVAAAFDSFEGLSALLAGQAANGSSQLSSGSLRLTGTKSDVNIFQVSADTLQQATEIRITLPTNAGAVVNVTGSSVAIQNKNVVLQGATAANLLWNVPQAGFVQIGSIGLPGSVLAPGARLTFESGSITGTVVARGFQSPGSGSLLSAPLNAPLLFGSTTPSSVSLKPQQALARGCTYDFVMPATQGFTSNGNCLDRELRVSFRVARGPSTPASRELAKAQRDPALGTLRRFEARPGINTPVADIWARYESGLGVARSSLVATGVSRPNPTRPGEDLRMYQQFHRGYPIAGFGYLVASQNGIFRNATGRAAANLPSTLPTPVSSASAVQAAVQFAKITNPPWQANPAKYHPPLATLALIPQKPSPSGAADFRLLWDVNFFGTGVSDPGAVQIDAGNGTVAGSYPGTNQVSYLASGATYVRQLNDTVDTVFDGTQPFHPAQYAEPGGALTKTPASRAAGPGRLATLLQLTPLLGGDLLANPPVEIVDTTSATPWLANEDAIERAIASAHWSLESANAYLGTLLFSLTGAPWTSVDGTGHQQVIVRFWQPGDNRESRAEFFPYRSDADTAVIVLTDGPPAAPVGRFEVPHEFGHLLLWNVRRLAGLFPALPNRSESGSINEALADLFAAGSVHAYFGEPADWACFRKGTVCVRDPANPPGHTPPNPSYYGDLNYQSFASCTESNDQCAVHRNSTVVSFWGYLLGKGSAATPAQNPCGLTIDPLDSNADVALRRVINIGEFAAGTRLSTIPPAEPYFADFRDATLAVARDLESTQLAPSDTVRKLELAWYAVGLGPEFVAGSTALTPSPADVIPFDDDASVYPWQTFSWPSNGNGQNGTSWDFQIFDGPIDASQSNLRHEEIGVTETLVRDSVTLNVVHLALPFDSPNRFYWRVRPHTTGAWRACYPVHSFVTTARPGDIQSIVPTVPPENGKFPAGSVTLSWEPVEGAQSYRVYASTQDPNCGSGPDVIEAASSTGSAQIHGLQPQSHYFINVQPVGPRDFAGAPSLGGCFKTEIDTVALQAPILRDPTDASAFEYDGSDPANHSSLVWDAFDEPQKFRVTFYEIDETNTCATTPVTPAKIVDMPCGTGACRVSLPVANLFNPRNPSGYCWTVTSIAGNGRESPPSSRRRFYYILHRLQKTGPGEHLGAVTLGHPNSLGKRSYGTDLVFNWEPQSFAQKYMLKVGRWPWNQLAASDPPRCTFPVGPNDSLPAAGVCESGSTLVTYRSEVAGPGTTVSGNSASKGRYCWAAWPEVADPRAPGTIGNRQPFVEDFPLFCYTSGPAQPEIMFDNAPAAGTFPSANITGRVKFAYVPDRQYEVVLGPGADFQWHLEHCDLQPNAAVYSDLYDCRVEFEITPHEQRTYTINAKVWASDTKPPIMDSTTLAYDETRTLTTSACGANGEPCCGTTCDVNLACQNAKCVPCGGHNQPCCGGSCAGTFDLCDNGICKSCGNAVGDLCCPNKPNDPGPYCAGLGIECLGARCGSCGAVGGKCCGHDTRHGAPSCVDPTMSVCLDDTCTPCGHEGQQCCPHNIGTSGSNCVGNLTCLSDLRCHASGGGGGSTEACNSQVHEGGNTAEFHILNLGKTSGTTRLRFQTFEIADQIVVFYQGSPVFDTTCFGTANVIGCDITGRICCDGSVCEAVIPYSGSSSEMTVVVSPNCLQDEPTTKWNFLLTCP